VKFDPEKLIEGVQDYIVRALTPFADRIKALEAREPLRGEKGERGADGIAGAAGDKGDKGEPGADGKDGVDGKPGEKGDSGEDGHDGMDGKPGEKGEKGNAGEPGKDGAPGEKGDKGDAGQPGRDGQDGTAGAKGEKGDKGDPGIDGKDGADGKPGETGAPGKDGKDGRDGRDGKDGLPGKDGRDGADGRDASEIDVLGSIDPEKSYRKGVFAADKGGLWRSKGGQDWQLVINGVQQLSIDHDGERGFTLRELMADGSVVEKAVVIPCMIYRGVYAQGKTYERGDCVTFAGSLFHCNDKTDERPGTGAKSWTLAVKRGADGKDKA